MEIASLTLFIGALLIAAGSPGPSIAALVSRVITGGWRGVLPFVAAMWIGEVAWLTVPLAGLSQLAAQFHLGFVVLKWVGIAYLLWMALGMWRAAVTPQMSEAAERSTTKNAASLFATGLALTLGNPKIMVFYLALLPSLIDLSQVGVTQWAILATATVLTLALIDGIWILAAERARSLLRTPRALRLSNRISAMTLGGAAVLLAAKS